MGTSLRHFRFGLRTLLVLVTVVSIPCAWVGHSLNWIRQRQAARESAVMFDAGIGWWSFMPTSAPPAPNGLGLFGERGYGWLCVRSRDKADADRIHRLFPEAGILITGDGVVVYKASAEHADSPASTGFSTLSFKTGVADPLPKSVQD